jgi:protein phosphatase 1 regulatory subunit 7
LNHLKEIEGLEGVINLESLWLGKNKIEEIKGLRHLGRLRQLDIQNNRLLSLGDDLSQLCQLQELYLACNNIKTLQGLPCGDQLKIVDLSTNGVEDVSG